MNWPSLHALGYPLFSGSAALPPVSLQMPTDPSRGTAAHHGTSEASGVLKPGGTAGTIWAQVEGL